jgi:5-methylcytosine-specific restriction endonuclease McrA
MFDDYWVPKREVRERLFKQQKGLCFYCNKRMSLTSRRAKGQPAKNFATFEHLIRRSEGGKFTKENIVLAHRVCNSKKNIEDQASIACI